MADIFQPESETYEVDIPKEKRYLNTMSYDYSVQYLYELIKKVKSFLKFRFNASKFGKTIKLQH